LGKKGFWIWETRWSDICRRDRGEDPSDTRLCELWPFDYHPARLSPQGLSQRWEWINEHLFHKKERKFLAKWKWSGSDHNMDVNCWYRCWWCRDNATLRSEAGIPLPSYKRECNTDHTLWLIKNGVMHVHDPMRSRGYRSSTYRPEAGNITVQWNATSYALLGTLAWWRSQ
jgi:hypothetical protein